MAMRDVIGDPDLLLRKTPANPKYEHVKPVVETGMTAELARFMKNTGAALYRVSGEPFMRIRTRLIGDFVQKQQSQSGEIKDGGFAHPMDEYRAPDTQLPKEYLILDVRSEEEYAACHIKGALHYPKRRMVHAINPLLPEMFNFKNKENKLIVLYDLEEEMTIAQGIGQSVFEKGIDNLAVMTGGLREFVQDYADCIVGESPVPIVPRDTRLLKRAEAVSAARSETQRSAFSHKPKSLSNSLAKPRPR
ncbi:rhodanese-like domain containing protein [Trypanosoma brucei equiperdum]|uniref:Rhodanese-like domain containing protein n=1 Tax=Trypanosoma brucei equiperdum TaxID=630700 RepID=A0A3L6LC76_9TRYP|nr:rhodanese-like domain containing protein [Trypanosoma brucei equiperdum]